MSDFTSPSKPAKPCDGHSERPLRLTSSIPPASERTVLALPTSPFSGDLLSGRSWPTPEMLAGDVMAAAAMGEPAGLREALAPLGVRLVELAPTVLSARVSLAAAMDGRYFVHHELRGALPLPPALGPERAVDPEDDEDGLVPLPKWELGARTAPKYFSACLESSTASYDPGHRRKWRPHELLHRLARVMWRPDITRFEAYLSARTAELLPVVHWYGLDEIGRRCCPLHGDVALAREHCAACELALVPYWEVEQNTEYRRRALRHARHGLDHLLTELSAVHQELETGRRVSTPRGRLDASSDAEGYLHGHWNRITAWSYGAWVEHFQLAGVDYFERGADHLAHVAGLAEHLLSGSCEHEPEVATRRRARHRLADAGQRAFLVLEWSEDERLEDALLPLLEDGAELARRLHDGVAEAVEADGWLAALDSTVAECSGLLPERVQVGWGPRAELPLALDVDTHELEAGIESALPETAALLGPLGPLAQRLVAHPAFVVDEELATRLLTLLESEGGAPPLVRLEAFLRARPRRDEEAELFAVVPDAPTGPGELRCSTTLRRGQFDAADVQQLLGFEVDGDGPVRLCAIWQNGTPRALIEDELTTGWLDRIEAAALDGNSKQAAVADSTVRALCDGGFLVWLPAPR